MRSMLVGEGAGAGALLQSSCHAEGHLLVIGHLESAAFLVAMSGEKSKRLEIIHGLFTPSLCD